MIRKKILLLGILILAGILCFSQAALATEEEKAIFSIGNLGGELIDWDSDISVWHGSIVLNATVLVTNTGNESIQIQWKTTNTEDMFSVPGNWQGEVKLGITYNFFKNEFWMSIAGI